MEINHVQYKKYRKVRDHCNYTGEHRDSAQSICNLKYNVPGFNKIKNISSLNKNKSKNDSGLKIDKIK